MPNPGWNPEVSTREFRVKKVVRYIVTDWSDYRGGESVTEVCGPSTLEQANAIAAAMGALHPGSLVNPMEPEPQSYGAPLCETGLIKSLPYEMVAAMRVGARARGDAAVLATLDRLRVAVDA